MKSQINRTSEPDKTNFKSSQASLNLALKIAILLVAFSALASAAPKTPVLVAVIDTGADLTHPQLENAFWQNPGETGKDKDGNDKATNGIDDDNNGFIDDVNGFNFVDTDSKLTDRHGHGTHIAGIIHKRAPNAKLMILKYYDPYSPIGNMLNTSRAIRYAIQMGARIINYSGGGNTPDFEERAAILEAKRKGILVVAAAGNEGHSTDARGFFPASYKFENIISVASLNEGEQLLKSSNFGRTVDIAALGEDIISTLPKGKTGPMTGTSQATAIVTGLAALIAESETDALEIKERVIRYGKTEQSLKGKIASSRALNFERSLASRGTNKDAFDNASSVTENIFENQSVWGASN